MIVYIILIIMAVVALVAFTAKLPKHYPPNPDCEYCKGLGSVKWQDYDGYSHVEQCECTKEGGNDELA